MSRRCMMMFAIRCLALIVLYSGPATASTVTASAGSGNPATDPEFASQANSTVSSGVTIDGFASADLATGELRGSVDTSAPPGQSVVSRETVAATMADVLNIHDAGASSGYIDVILSATGALSANPSSQGGTFAGTSFAISVRRINGGNTAQATIAWDTRQVGPSILEQDRGTPGVAGSVDATVVPLGAGGTLNMRIWVNAGDQVSFSSRGSAYAWSASNLASTASSDFNDTTVMDVQPGPGLDWSTDSGVFLSLPEPAMAALVAPGILGLLLVSKARTARARAM